MKKRKNSHNFLQDGVTKYSDPFWDLKCDSCGYEFWGADLTSTCPKCKCSSCQVLNNNHITEISRFNKHR